MYSVTAVLLALVLIALVVILLIVWLVQRSRSSDLPRGRTSYGPGADVGGRESTLAPVPPERQHREGSPADEELRAGNGQHAGDEAAGDLADGPAQDVAPLPDPASSDPEAAATEYVGSGLSELDDQTAVDDEDSVGRPAARTPTEAFGSAQVSGDAVAHEAASRETSVLDEADVDSTPLFRSIREELLGTGAAEGSAEATRDQADPPETAGDDTLTEGVVETGAEGAGPLDPPAEEEELLQTSQETQDKTVETSPSGEAPEHPPIRRLSALEEVVDGGFGIGSAKPIADGAQPLGHPIKANVDTKTYQDLHSPWYDETEPDVWFLDAGFAERAGFHRAE